MADFNKITNTPIEMEIAGRKYKVRRVGLGTIFGNAEAAVISSWMKNMLNVASHLKGDEKTNYMAVATQNAPAGNQLNKAAEEFLRSLSGVQMVVYDALRADQPAIEQELSVAELLSERPEVLKAIVQFATGGIDNNASVPLAPTKQQPS